MNEDGLHEELRRKKERSEELSFQERREGTHRGRKVGKGEGLREETCGAAPGELLPLRRRGGEKKEDRKGHARWKGNLTGQAQVDKGITRGTSGGERIATTERWDGVQKTVSPRRRT